MVSKRNLLFQGLLFRFHFKFLGCIAILVDGFEIRRSPVEVGRLSHY